MPTDPDLPNSSLERPPSEPAADSRVWPEAVDPVLGLDERGVVRDANEAAARMFGRSRLQGAYLRELLEGPTSGGGRFDLLVRDLATRRDIHAVRADGTQIPVDVALVRIPAEAVSFTCIIRDRTEAQAASQALVESREQLRLLAARLVSCREQERIRIARELHDELGQQLTAIRMDLGWLTSRLGGAPELAERSQALVGLVDGAFAAIRRLGTELRPAILDDLGLVEALEWQAAEFEERSGIRVVLDLAPEAERLGPSLSTTLFRIFQESLTNVGRHSGAEKVEGRLSVGDEIVTLEVADDGRGISPEEATDPSSLGLLGMRERAALHQGSFRIGAGERGGTTVSVILRRAAGPDREPSTQEEVPS